MDRSLKVCWAYRQLEQRFLRLGQQQIAFEVFSQPRMPSKQLLAKCCPGICQQSELAIWQLTMDQDDKIICLRRERDPLYSSRLLFLKDRSFYRRRPFLSLK